MVRLFKILAYSGAVVLCLAFAQRAKAQVYVPKQILTTDSLKNAATGSDTLESDNKLDAIDLVKMLFKKKKVASALKPQKEKDFFFTIIPYPGYTIATGFAAVLPTNFSFYVKRNEKENLSFFNNQIQYTQHAQVLAQSLSNLYLAHSNWILIGDLRYFNFPTYTFGLGSESKTSDQDRIDYSHLRVYEFVMHKIVKNFSAGLGYQLDYHWNIKDYNASAGDSTDFLKYGFKNKSLSSGPAINILYDSRDNTNDPKSGAYLNLTFRPNLKVFGSDNNWNSLVIDSRIYVPLTIKQWKSVFAFWFYFWLTPGNPPPYLDLPSTGWDTYNNTGRGYAMGRFRGRNMVYFEAEYRFPILTNGLLGGVVFANLESLSEWPSNNFSTFQPGIGLGLRLKINKQTHTNAAMDFGFGSSGSRGFAFNLNEVY